ncbi:MAG: SgcJ/EcaC family oxidoreductase [Actinobacteria bacterium]|nr:SgcJ/EcaC family oxidoreductase [Actinomycetota bacterium]
MEDDRRFEAVMREQIRAMNTGDPLAVANLFTEDGRFVDMGDPHAAYVGRESIRLLVDSFIQEHDLSQQQGHSRIAVVRMVSRGSIVVTELHFDCHFIGPGSPPGGVRLEWGRRVIR